MTTRNVNKKGKPTKKEKDLAISKRNVQKLSAENVKLREILRKVIKTLIEKGIEIDLRKKEKEFLTLG